MRKSIEVIFILLIITCKSAAQMNVNFLVELEQDSLAINDLKELNSLESNVKLENLRVVNQQMDSILTNIDSKKNNFYVSSYYMGLAMSEEGLYIEIMHVDTHNNLVDFIENGKSTDLYLREGSHVLGCIVYNDSYFYLISFPSVNKITEDSLGKLFKKTSKKILITKEKIDSSIYFLESPIQLYQYADGKIFSLQPSSNK